MTRKSVVNELFYLPWWVSVVLAAVFYIAIKLVLPLLTINNPVAKALSGALTAFVTPVCIGLLCLAIAAAIRTLISKKKRKALFEKQQGIETIRQLSWDEFERLIAEYFERQGYDVTENNKKGADNGVDLRLARDGQHIIVQCKQWANKVGAPIVREHIGAVTALGASRGIVVTSSAFTRSAITLAQSNNVTLIDGSDLAAYFERRNSAGPVPRDQESVGGSIRPVEIHCPVCHSTMIKRTAKKGKHTGRSFFGCSNFPACRGTRDC